MSRSRPALMSILGVLLCGAPQASQAQLYEVRDSAGVEIIISGPGGSTSRWALSADPVVTIGQMDGPEAYLFTDVWDALKASDGRLVVVDAGTYDIRVFDETGRHLVTFGQRGSGPEEFGGPPWLSLTRGDTLVVWDPGHYRLSQYSLGGQLLEQTTIASWIAELGIRPFPNGLVWQTASNGSLLWTGPARAGRRTEGLADTFSDVVLLDAWSEESHHFGRHLSGQTYWMRDGSGFRGLGSWSAPSAAVALDAAPERVAIGDPELAEVRTYDGSGALMRVLKVQVPRTPITGDMVEARRQELPEIADRLRTSLRSLQRAFDEMPVPDSLPAIARLAWDTSHNLWVGQRHSDRWSVPEYNVFDSDGHWLASVQIPDGVRRLISAGDDYILAAGIGQYDVQFLQVYRIHRPGS